MPVSAAVVLVGLGGDPGTEAGVGAAVVRTLAERRSARAYRLLTGIDPIDLLGKWDDTDLAVVVDATRSHAPVGSIRVTELTETAIAHGAVRPFAHGDDLSAMLRLAQAIGNAPRRVVVVGVEAEDFGPGRGLTGRVTAAVDSAAVVALDLARLLGPHLRRRHRGTGARGLLHTPGAGEPAGSGVPAGEAGGRHRGPDVRHRS